MKRMLKIALIMLCTIACIQQSTKAAGGGAIKPSRGTSLQQPATPIQTASSIEDPYTQAANAIVTFWQEYKQELIKTPVKQFPNVNVQAFTNKLQNSMDAIITTITNLPTTSTEINQSLVNAMAVFQETPLALDQIYNTLSVLLSSLSGVSGILYTLTWDNRLIQYQKGYNNYQSTNTTPQTQTMRQQQEWINNRNNQPRVVSPQQPVNFQITQGQPVGVQRYPQPIGQNPYLAKQAALSAALEDAKNKAQNAAMQIGQPIASTASSVWDYGKSIYNSASAKWNEFWRWARPSEQDLIFAKMRIDHYKNLQAQGVTLSPQDLEQLQIDEATVAKWWPTILGVGVAGYYVWNNPEQAWSILTGAASTAGSIAAGGAKLGLGAAQVAGQIGASTAKAALTTKPGLIATGALGYAAYQGSKQPAQTQQHPVYQQEPQPQNKLQPVYIPRNRN